MMPATETTAPAASDAVDCSSDGRVAVGAARIQHEVMTPKQVLLLPTKECLWAQRQADSSAERQRVHQRQTHETKWKAWAGSSGHGEALTESLMRPRPTMKVGANVPTPAVTAVPAQAKEQASASVRGGLMEQDGAGPE